MRQSKFKEAFDINFIALKIVEKLGDESKQATILENIENLYYELEQNKSAELFFRKGFAFARKTNYLVMQGNILVNLGGLRFEVLNDSLVKLSEVDSALKYYNEAKVILEQINSQYNLGVVYNNLGRIYAAKKDYTRALYFYKMGLDIRLALHDNFGVGLSYIAIGEIEKIKKNYDKSIE
jgi:tetratricopeptide (TPR) repeat protein